MLAELYVLTGRDAGKGLSAGLGPAIFVGRAATNHLRVRDPQCSRVHCRVDVTSEGLTLHDNSSGNGTYVNGERIARSRRLDDGDEVQLGGTRIKILIETEEDREHWQRIRGLATDTGPEEAPDGPEPIRVAPRANSGPRTPAEEALAASASSTQEWSSAAAEDERPKGRSASRTGRKRSLREVLPGYRLEARLGGRSRAGMAVYRALQRSLDRQVALKVLLAKGPTSKRDVARFLREAKAVARLPHPNIVTIHDVVKKGTLNVIVMEYLAGGSLADRVADGPLPARRALRAGRAVARALAYAHEHEVCHRNVKPSNILYAPNVDTFKLADFGFATDPAVERVGDTTFLDTPLESFGYLAPEQLDPDHTADPRTDVYGLGATLFGCLAGAPPFTGASVPDIAARVLRDDPPELEGAPGALQALVARCLLKDPTERFVDAAEVLAALEDVG